MGSLAERKTLMRCIEQLEEKVMVNQHYRSSERGKAGMFWLQQLLLDFFFQHDLVAQFGSEQDWSASKKGSHNHKLSHNSEKNPKLGHGHRYI